MLTVSLNILVTTSVNLTDQNLDIKLSDPKNPSINGWLNAMKSKIIIGIVLGFVLGFFAHYALHILPDTARHWRAVDQYNAFMQNPSSYTTNINTGFRSAPQPYDIEPHLAALVEAGHLTHLDIVLPSVPYSRSATISWMAFYERHRDLIVFASGNPSWVAFKAKGEQPLHLNLWFKPSGERIVQELITELEHLKTEEKPTTGRTVPPAAGAPGVQ